jgi:hypothetical protein
MRSKNTILIAIASTSLLAAGCSQNADESAEADASEGAPAPAPKQMRDAANAVDAGGSASAEQSPGLTTSAAPGVAFAYNYAFALAAKAISGVQQQHAVACERLGPQKCQITGMSYDQPKKDEVSARLDLMLAPDLAQRFGVDVIAAVERADGTLETAQVDGQNAGGDIESSQRRSDTIRASLDRIEKRLSVKGLGADERQQLVQRADELRSQLREEVGLRGEKETALTLTPMSIAYGSEGLFASGGNPFGTAAKASMGSLETLLATLLTLGGIALPWLLVIAVIVLAVRFYRLKRQLAANTREVAAPQ